MPGTNQAARPSGQAPLRNAARRDLYLILGVLAALGGASWMFDRALDLL
jgi:hypothetical protein